MREAFRIAGKIVTGQATAQDRARLEHLLADKAKSLRKVRNLKIKRPREYQ